ncbi:hypothetical protein RJ641_003632 [Dillenia turbinata]|uniref:AP2/ERF domain-containing protein n=1 Tax=Dillenia turbinata TaxID=194707 RepID=A0AAN8VE47_9MAGN
MKPSNIFPPLTSNVRTSNCITIVKWKWRIFPSCFVEILRKKKLEALYWIPRSAANAMGRYAAEIRNPYTKEPFDTAEEAALAYDFASISFCGMEIERTNFRYTF